jgi:signal transduction histidine kinase
MTAIESPTLRSRADALVRITQAIETATNLDELLMLTLAELTQLFEVEHGGVLLLHEDHQIAQIVSEFPPFVSPPAPFFLDDYAILSDLVNNRVLIQTHASDDRPLDPFLQAHSAISALLVPLISQDRVIAILFLCSQSSPHHFNDVDETLARVLAGQMAAAFTSFRLSAAAERRSQELSTLNEIAAAVTSTLDSNEVYRLVVQKLNKYFQVDAGSILLLDETTGNLHFVMTIEGGEERLAGYVVPRGEGIVGHVVTTGEPEIVLNVQQDPRFYRDISESLGYVTNSILCVPMLARGRVIGAIELLNKLDGQFTLEDADRLTRMAAFIGVAIENARLFQQVADGRDRLAAILNSTTDGILMVNLDGLVVTANPHAMALLRISEADLGNTRRDVLIQSLLQVAVETNVRTWEAETGETQSVTEFVLPGSPRRFVRHLTLPVRDAHNVIYAELEIFRDISQEKALEQLREDYTGMLVHDLRAPLTSIMNGVAMVQRGMVGDVSTQQRELLGIAMQGSRTLLDMVNTLLDIGKMEQGRMPLYAQPVALANLVAQVIDRLNASANAGRVKVSLALAPDVPVVEADEEKITRVMQNLLDNAIKFSPTGGTVTIGAQYYTAGQSLVLALNALPDPIHDRGADWAIVWVRDQGLGIPVADRDRIFEKFGQVRGRKNRGTGLGLTFCKHAIEAHNGQIWLESEEGKGSTFAFALPVRALP